MARLRRRTRLRRAVVLIVTRQFGLAPAKPIGLAALIQVGQVQFGIRASAWFQTAGQAIGSLRSFGCSRVNSSKGVFNAVASSFVPSSSPKRAGTRAQRLRSHGYRHALLIWQTQQGLQVICFGGYGSASRASFGCRLRLRSAQCFASGSACCLVTRCPRATK
jgi:hypothetical protein